MSTFGSLFRVTTYGESHCASVGAIIDGVPPVSHIRQHGSLAIHHSNVGHETRPD